MSDLREKVEQVLFDVFGNVDGDMLHRVLPLAYVALKMSEDHEIDCRLLTRKGRKCNCIMPEAKAALNQFFEGDKP